MPGQMTVRAESARTFSATGASEPNTDIVKKIEQFKGTQSPCDHFHTFFSVSIAETYEDISAAKRVRYQVYCNEMKTEDARQFPDGRETDVYDERAVHAVLRYKPGGCAIGTVRLIRPQGDGVQGLPVDHLPSKPFASKSYLLNAKLAEVSRFCVVRSMRQREGEDRHADVKWPYQSEGLSVRRLMPNISLGLMRGIVMIARKIGVNHLCAVMDPVLLMMLRRMGVDFQPVGPLVEHHGRRQPCHRALAEISAEMKHSHRALWDIVFESDFIDVRQSAARRTAGELVNS